MKLPSELVVAHRKREVRRAIRYKRRAARRVAAREAETWDSYQRKLAHAERRTCEPNGNC